MALSMNPTLKEIIDEIERLNNLIVDRGGAKTITPKTTNQVLSKGNYKGDITILGDADLIASNIRSGKNVFGVNGTLIEGRRVATGTAGYSDVLSGAFYNYVAGSQIGMYSFRITNLGFTPSTIIALTTYDGTRDILSVYTNLKGISSAPTLKFSSHSNADLDARSRNFQANSTFNPSAGVYQLPTVLQAGMKIEWIAYE